jgi:hypothetical protein
MTPFIRVATCVITALAVASMGMDAAAQTYHWVSATQPPDGAVRAPDGERRFLCSGMAQRPGFDPGAVERFTGDWRDDGCHADDGGHFLSTRRDLLFLAVTSGPDGGQWAPCNIHRYQLYTCYLPGNFVRYRSWMSDNQAICATNGVPGTSYVAPNGGGEYVLEACDITVSPMGMSPKILVGAFN